MNGFGKFNEIYGKYFTSKPARSYAAVKTLPKNVLVEVECIALTNYINVILILNMKFIKIIFVVIN